MTQVFIDTDGARRVLSAEGHSSDVASCNYITGVLYALAGFVHNEERQGRAEIFCLSLEPGSVVIDAEGGERLDVAFEMACIGLLQLQQQEPEAVRVEITGH